MPARDLQGAGKGVNGICLNNTKTHAESFTNLERYFSFFYMATLQQFLHCQTENIFPTSDFVQWYRTQGVVIALRFIPFRYLSQKTPVEFFGLPFDDQILHEARFTDGILAGCSGVLAEIGKKRIYDDHLSISPTREAMKSFFTELAKLSPEHQEMCFEEIVKTLSKMGEGVKHVEDRLRKGKRYKNIERNEIGWCIFKSALSIISIYQISGRQFSCVLIEFRNSEYP